MYIIAVNDNAVAEVSSHLKLNNKIVAHTAGSVPMHVLKNTSANFGVFYPLQSLRKELNYLPVVPFLIDGNNDLTKDIILKLASSVSQICYNC